MSDHDTISEFPAAAAVDVAAEVLATEPSNSQVGAAGRLIESMAFTTTALKAVAAYIETEFDAGEQAALIRSILPQFAALEGASL
jgi:predicted TPR repeat methyltransferase